MGLFSSLKKKAKKAVGEVSKAVSDPIGAAKEAAQTVQSTARTTVTALHTEALADIGNLAGRGGLLRDPVTYAKNVKGGIVTDLKTGARVMGQFGTGKWDELASEAVLDLGTVAKVDPKTLAKYAEKAGKAGAAYMKVDEAYRNGGATGLAGLAATQLGVPPEVVALGAGAVSAYNSGGPDAVKSWAEQVGKAELSRQTGVPISTIDAIGDIAANPQEAARLAQESGQVMLGNLERSAAMNLSNLGGLASKASAFTSSSLSQVSQVASAAKGSIGTVKANVAGAAGMLSKIRSGTKPPGAISQEAAGIASAASQQAQPVVADIKQAAASVPAWGWVAAAIGGLFLLMRR